MTAAQMPRQRAPRRRSAAGLAAGVSVDFTVASAPTGRIVLNPLIFNALTTLAWVLHVKRQGGAVPSLAVDVVPAALPQAGARHRDHSRDALRRAKKGREGMALREGVSESMAQFIARLSPHDRDSLLDVLRDSRTFLAEDLTDVIAILRTLDS